MKKYFAIVKLKDNRVMVMNNNWFMAKNERLAMERAKVLFDEMVVIEVREHK